MVCMVFNIPFCYEGTKYATATQAIFLDIKTQYFLGSVLAMGKTHVIANAK